MRASLARRLDVPDTTLSDWLRGVHPAPPDLAFGLRVRGANRAAVHIRVEEVASEALDVSDVELRCSIPSPEAHGRYAARKV